jgi:hypothetical protein
MLGFYGELLAFYATLNFEDRDLSFPNDYVFSMFLAKRT